MTQEELDRLSVLLRDAHNALEEAWKLCVYAGETQATNCLVLADVRVLEVDEAFDDLYSVFDLYSVRV